MFSVSRISLTHSRCSIKFHFMHVYKAGALTMLIQWMDKRMFAETMEPAAALSLSSSKACLWLLQARQQCCFKLDFTWMRSLVQELSAQSPGYLRKSCSKFLPVLFLTNASFVVYQPEQHITANHNWLLFKQEVVTLKSMCSRCPLLQSPHPRHLPSS